MPVFFDQLNREVFIAERPQRIVSLVPSQTELLYDIGLRDEVVGITKFCIHPTEWFRSKTRIGGTKTVNIQKVKTLQPDLIIANKEENVQAQIEELATSYPVWVSDVNTLHDAFEMMKGIGAVTGKLAEANAMIKSIEEGFGQWQQALTKQRVAYLIWKDPYMAAGGDTFINDIITKAGLENVFADKRRYPTVSIDDLQDAYCQLLFLSSEPYPFQQKHVHELQQYLPQTKIMLVDGEMFSWYGSRLLKLPAYLHQLQKQMAAVL